MEKRNTIQKQLVLDAVFRLANHPTAEEVYAEVARSHPTVSKATVYRNLGSLSEDGLLRHIKMPGGADRFDHMLLEHHHIICTQCGCFADAPASGSAGRGRGTPDRVLRCFSRHCVPRLVPGVCQSGQGVSPR